MNPLILAAILCGQYNPCPNGQCVQPTYERPPVSRVVGPVADPYSRVVVRIANEHGNSTSFGSGVILTRSGLVLTCKHIFRGGVGRLTVRRSDGKSWEAQLIAVDKRDDLSAVMIADPGPIPLILFASKQPPRTLLVGFPGGGTTAVGKSGVETSSVTYGFNAVDGDSGGPVFVQGPVKRGDGKAIEPGTLGLAGVLWGSDGQKSFVTSSVDVERFLREKCIRFFSRGPYINYGTQPIQPIQPIQPLPQPIYQPVPVDPTPIQPIPPVVATPLVPMVDLGPLTARVAALESQMSDVGRTLTNLNNITSAHSATLAKGIAFSVNGPGGIITSAPAHLGDSVDLNPFFVPATPTPVPPVPTK